MTIKYAVFKPQQGQYEYYESEELAANAFLTYAINHYRQIISGEPISIVEINDDGSEQWYGDSLKVTPIENGNVLLEKLKDVKYRRSLILTKDIMNIINQANTNNEIPVTVIGE